MEKIYELHADVCKILANAKRIEILNMLKDREMSAGELLEKTRLSKANLSQHMTVLKSKGVIITRKDGLKVYYAISNPKIIQACNLMKEVLLEQLQEKGQMALTLEKRQ